jgi:hypothetical protein
VILPPMMENLNYSTAHLLALYASDGGRLLCAGDWPSHCNGNIPPMVQSAGKGNVINAENLGEVFDGLGGKKVSPDEAVAAAKKRTAETGLSITVPDGTRSVFHHRRQLPGYEILFVCNTDMEKSVEVQISIPKNKYILGLSLESGEVTNRCVPTESDTVVHTLFPSGSIAWVIFDAAIECDDLFSGYKPGTVMKNVPGTGIPARQFFTASCRNGIPRLPARAHQTGT